MRHVTHLIFSIFFITGIVELFPSLHDLELYGLFLIIGSFATLIPDIDHPRSYISQIYWGFTRKSVIIRHRGWTHSLFGLSIFTIIFIFILWIFGLNLIYSIPFFLGYLAHLLIDSLNPTGVRWLYPRKKAFSIGIIKTGSKEEETFKMVIIALFVILLVHDAMFEGGLL